MMIPNTNGPIFIMKEGTERNQGRAAQSNNIAAAKAVADAIRTTLGPKGMDKMLVDEGGDVIITNDGATILREMDIEHPAAKMIIEVAKTQEQECYDGTTTAVILAGELLKKSEELVEQNIHPTVICSAFRKCGDQIQTTLDDLTMSDIDYLNIAKTALTGKSADSIKTFLGQICVDVVAALDNNSRTTQLKGSVDLDLVNVVKAIGGEVQDSTMYDGIILPKERCHSGMPHRVNTPNILITNSPIEVKTTEMDASIQITDPNQITAFLEQEEKQIKDIVNLIVSKGINVVVCQKEIDDLAKHYFAKVNILAIEKVKKSDIDALSLSTGAKIVTNLDDLKDDDSDYDLGQCYGAVEEKKVGEMPMIFFDDPVCGAVTLLLRGGTVPFVEEIERAFDDAVGVVAVAWADNTIVTGGGSTFLALSGALHKLSKENSNGRERMAIEAFADALEIVPRTLIENAGLDPVDEMATLRNIHRNKKPTKEYTPTHYGVNVEGGVMDMAEAGICEPRRVVEQAIKSAIETATMILRIDDVISSRKAGPQ